MLLDATNFVDLARNYSPAIKAFKKFLHGQSASIITKFEIMVGSRTKDELSQIEKRLDKLAITFIPLDSYICEVAETIIRNYYHAHGIGIQDALIAATAILNNEELATNNIKHFDFIPDLKIIKPY